MPRKKIPIKATDNLLVSMMNDMNGKLHHIHKDVEKNSKDIEKLKQEIAFGRGGVRVFVWAVGLVTAILGYLNFK